MLTIDMCPSSTQTFRIRAQKGTAWPHTELLCRSTVTAKYKWAPWKMSDTGHVIKLWRPRFIHRRKTCIKECQLTRTPSLAKNDWTKVFQGRKRILMPPVSKIYWILCPRWILFKTVHCIHYWIRTDLVFHFTIFIINEEYYETNFYMASSCLRQAVISLSQVTTQGNRDTILHECNPTCVLEWIHARFLCYTYTLCT